MKKLMGRMITGRILLVLMLFVTACGNAADTGTNPAVDSTAVEAVAAPTTEEATAAPAEPTVEAATEAPAEPTVEAATEAPSATASEEATPEANAPVAGGASAASTLSCDLESLEITELQEIEFWHIQATIYGEAIKEMVQQFNTEHQGTIQVNEVFQGSYGDLNQKLRAALQGGGLPVLAMAYENDTLEYMKAGVAQSLDPFIASAKHGLTEEQINDLAPAVLARQRIPQYEGLTMSWPHGNSANGMYYNIDILEQAGLSKPAATWEEFLEQARTIKETTGLPTLPLRGPGGMLRNMIRSYGVDLYNEDATASNFDNAAAVESLTMMKTMVDEGLAIITEESEQEFTNARTAMEMGTTARTSTKLELIADQFQWGITLTPQGASNQEPVTDLYGGNQVMFKQEDCQRALAGWEFLKYFAGPEAQAIYATRTGYFPASLSASETELLSQNYAENPQKQQAFDEVFPAARLANPTAADNAINDMVNNLALEVLLDRQSPEDAVAQMKTEADRLLSEQAR